MLRNHTPSSSEIDAATLAQNNGKALLVLTVPMNSQGKMHDKTIYGSSYSSLVFEFIEQHAKPSHNVKLRTCARISTQVYEQVKAGIAESWRKASEGFNLETEHTFDCTVLSYVLGFIAMRSAFNQKVSLGRPAALGLLEEKSFSMANNDFIVLKHLYKDPFELYSLLCILKLCGISQAYLAVPGVEKPISRALTGKTLALFCCTLQKKIEATAEVSNCFSHHASAFFRGMTSAVTLRAHSDEGGFIRNVCKIFSGPRPTGVITEKARATGSTEPWMMALNGVRKWVLDTFLVGVACAVAADPCSEVAGTKYPACVEHSSLDFGAVAPLDQCWTDYPTLFGLTEDWFTNFLDMFSAAYQMQGGTRTHSTHSLGYFDLQNEDQSPHSDRHLKEWKAAPFMWVDPSTVCFGQVKPAYSTATMTDPLVLPLWQNEAYQSSTYRVSNGNVVSGSKTILSMKGTSLRNQGLWYLLNTRWNKEDGLAAFKLTIQPAKGATNVPAFARKNGETLADLTWYTWDSCTPHPLNCLTTDREVVFFRHISVYPKSTPTLDEWKSPVSISVGVMSIDTRPYNPMDHNRDSRYLPAFYVNAVRDLDPYQAAGHTEVDEFWRNVPDVLGHAGTLSAWRYAQDFGDGGPVAEYNVATRDVGPPSTDKPDILANDRIKTKTTKHPEEKHGVHDFGYNAKLAEVTGQGKAKETATEGAKTFGRQHASVAPSTGPSDPPVLAVVVEGTGVDHSGEPVHDPSGAGIGGVPLRRELVAPADGEDSSLVDDDGVAFGYSAGDLALRADQAEAGGDGDSLSEDTTDTGLVRGAQRTVKEALELLRSRRDVHGQTGAGPKTAEPQ